MKETFYLIAHRFHTERRNKLLVVGCFSNNDISCHKISFFLDNEELSYYVEEECLKPVQFDTRDGNLITKRYYMWIDFPENWKACQQFRLSSRYGEGDGQEIIFEVSDLKELSQQLQKYIDIIRVEKDGFFIEGWFIGNNDAKVEFITMNGVKLSVEIKDVLRPDVMWVYPETKPEDVHGFRAVYKGVVPSKLVVCFQSGKKKAKQIVKLHDGRFKQAVKSTMDLCRKTVVYWKQFGLEETIRRAEDKICGRKYTEYEAWMRRNLPFKSDLRKQRQQKFLNMPKISIVVPLYKTPEKYLKELIKSIQDQTYSNWELCLSDGSGKNSPLTDLLKEYAEKEKRIRVVNNERQLHISDNTNEALKIATGDYIAFADHDDLLSPEALYECVCVINAAPDTELIYSDEDKVNMEGTEYFMPHFKPDFNLDYLRTNNYICHLMVVKRELYEKVGGLNPECDGAQDFDFVLRCTEQTTAIKHIPKVLYHWRAHKDSTAESVESKPYITEAGVRAVQSHYDRLEIKTEVVATKYTGIYRSKFELTDKPLISVIIPNKDHVKDLDKCIHSLEKKSSYKNMEYIIVENNSEEEETFLYYEKLEKEIPKVKVVHWTAKGFNYPAINNYGVQYAKGEYLLFLNNDTEILNETSIEEMLVYGMRSDVGAVGAKLYYEDGSIQHAGVILGLGGVAGHSFVGVSKEAPGYFCRAIVPQNLSAVTAACMLMRRNVYDEVGGFDEGYAVAFNDVDLCMKIRQAGYLIVYTPYAELYHYESKSRGYDDTQEKKERFAKEVFRFQERWGGHLAGGDPYYNPNLTLNRNDFSINENAVRKRN